MGERMLILYDSILEFLPGPLTQKPGREKKKKERNQVEVADWCGWAERQGAKGWLKTLPGSTPEESCLSI